MQIPEKFIKRMKEAGIEENDFLPLTSKNQFFLDYISDTKHQDSLWKKGNHEVQMLASILELEAKLISSTDSKVKQLLLTEKAARTLVFEDGREKFKNCLLKSKQGKKIRRCFKNAIYISSDAITICREHADKHFADCWQENIIKSLDNHAKAVLKQIDDTIMHKRDLQKQTSNNQNDLVQMLN